MAEEDDSIRPIVALNVINPATKEKISTYALLDTGSDRDVIDESLAKELKLKTRSRMMNVQVLGVQDLSPRDVASISIASLDGKYEAEVENALVGNLLTCNSDIPPAKRNFDRLQHLAHLEFYNIDADIRMIISVDHCESLAAVDPNCFVNGPPHAVKTAFGWTILGQDKRLRSSRINAASANDEALQEKLDRIFFIDFTEVSEEEFGESREHREAIHQLKESIRFDKDMVESVRRRS